MKPAMLSIHFLVVLANSSERLISGWTSAKRRRLTCSYDGTVQLISLMAWLNWPVGALHCVPVGMQSVNVPLPVCGSRSPLRKQNTVKWPWPVPDSDEEEHWTNATKRTKKVAAKWDISLSVDA